MQETHQCDCKKNMSSVDQEKQMIANWAQLVEDNIKIVVNANHYDPCKEQRLLIPFLKGKDGIGKSNGGDCAQCRV